MNILGNKIEYCDISDIHTSFDFFPNIPESVTSEQAALILSVSKETVRRLIDSGELTADINGTVSKKVITAFIESRFLANESVFTDDK